MSLTQRSWSGVLRRYWPLAGAAGIFVLFTAADQVWFRPTARHYEGALRHFRDLGLALDPDSLPAVPPPPGLLALVSNNSLTAAEAQERGNSGVLTARLLEDLTEVTSGRGIQLLGTEPGAVTQQPGSVLVRAHLKLRCSYPQFVALLDDFAHGSRLISADRLSLDARSGAGMTAELWVSRLILKQSKLAR